MTPWPAVRPAEPPLPPPRPRQGLWCSTSTVIARADELAGAAEIVSRKSAGTPVALVRGAADWMGQGAGRMLVREAGRDLFR